MPAFRAPRGTRDLLPDERAAALSVGVEHWAAHGGDLGAHVDQALAAIGDA